MLDLKRDIFKSREHGVFTFDMKSGVSGDTLANYVPSVRRKNARKELLVDYSDAFSLTR